MTRRASLRRCAALAFSIAAATTVASAQEGLSIGTVRTAAKQQAIRVAADYLKQIPSEYFDGSKAPAASGGAGWWVLAYPEAKLLTGEKDAFQGVVAKMTGTYARFHAKELTPGVWVVDMDRTMWMFPMSAVFSEGGARPGGYAQLAWAALSAAV